MNKAMQKALETDGEKLRALTGKEHGPFCDYCLGQGWYEVADHHTGEAKQEQCGVCYGTGLHNRLND